MVPAIALAAPSAPQLLYEVAYADTDAGGVVYHARYIEMAERSRNRTLRALGVPVAEMRARFGVLFVVKEACATHHRPAFVGDVLTLSSGMVTANEVRATWRTLVTRDGEPICDVEAQIAAFDPVAGGPCLLPAELMARLEAAPRLAPVRRAPAMKIGAWA